MLGDSRTKNRVGMLAVLMVCACASTQPWKPSTALDTRDDPNALRPGFGNAELHTWWPLTGAEIAALQGLEQAKQGDARALLALAILASGAERDAAAYAGYRQRVDQFIARTKPTIDAAADDWHRGYELHRAMHRVFFKAERTELGSYDLEQSRVTSIFSGGRYNCLSSAMLFAVLARGFGLPVRAVLVPTHVFIEMGAAAGGKIIEVETTSATGFDWVHDDRFYRQEAALWSSNRGLRPVTIEEYRQRSIVQPYRLMANGMRNRHVGESEQDRARLDEVAALVDPDDVELQRARVGAYANEAAGLYERNAWRTMVRLFDVVAPALSAIAARSKDGRTLELISWDTWYHSQALMVVGRSAEAMALMSAGITRIDPSWPDAAKLKVNYLSVLNNRLGEFIDKKDYPGALKVFADHRDVCRSDKICAGNVGVAYGNWSIEYQNAGDWQSARRVLQECATELPQDSQCRDTLKDLEGRHRF